MKLTFKEIEKNEEIKAYFEMGDKFLVARHITRHCVDHAMIVAGKAGDILQQLGFDEREGELARITGYMHDIGNVVNRNFHDLVGASIAHQILSNLQMDPFEIAEVMGGIGNHDELSGEPVSNVSAAVILADKSDVRRSRVRNTDKNSFDIHDRVNYAVINSHLDVNPKNRTVRLDITTDFETISIIEYFEIFLDRMLMCRKAAVFLNATFELIINGTKLL